VAESAEETDSFQQSAVLRRWAAAGAERAPLWFVRCAPLLFGAVFSVLLPSVRAQIRRNLRWIEGERSWVVEGRDIVWTLAQFARNLIESLAPERAVFGPREFQVRGRHRAEAFLASGQGALIVTAHVGPWDAAAVGLRSMGDVPVLMLMSKDADAEGGAFQDAVRESKNLSVLRIGDSGLDALPALQHLEAGGLVVAQLDRLPPSGISAPAQLFGREFPAPKGLFHLAALARVPMIPVFSSRHATGKRVVQVGEPIVFSRRPSQSELASCVAGAMAQLEAHVAAFPTQWFHFVPDLPQAAESN